MNINTKIKILLTCLAVMVLQACNNHDILKLDVSGTWGFKIDSFDQGVKEKWFNKNLNESVFLPGSMAENGKGNDITVNTQWTGNMWNDSLWYKDPKMKKYRKEGHIKVPFWLTPVKEYKGAAWYQKKVTIPESWSDKHIYLRLERVHWETTVWVDGIKLGMQNSLATAHQYTLDDVLSPGEHNISIRIDNRVKAIDVGVDAHSVSDNTQTNWNGIIGDMELVATPKVYLGNVKIYPNVSDKTVRVVLKIHTNSENSQKAQLILQVKEKSLKSISLPLLSKTIKIEGNQDVVVEYNMGENPKLWDEFNPNLYEMQLTLESDAGTDSKSIDFGMREFKAKGTVFTINERPIFLRGTLECAIFPKTGYPPTDVNSWKRIFNIIKKHGLNHMRFHSWCPPEAAFKAADELGVYLQIEASAWATIGDNKPIDAWLYKEAEYIIDAYGNHPSFVMMAYGNEPHGDNHEAYLVKFVDYFKNLDNRRVYASGAGWPYTDNADYYNNGIPRIQAWDQNLNSIINANPPQTTFDYLDIINKKAMPYVSHEIGQWCAYPNFKEMPKYTGVLKPKNFEIFKESLAENGMEKLADSFLLASGKLQTLCYKADIEAALRTKNMAGFQLLDLHDFPGQGTALVGVLDAFWDEKGYVTPEQYSEFCNQTVPLVRLEKRIFKNTDTLQTTVEIAHYGAKPLNDIVPTWTLTDTKGNTISKGELDETNIPIGNGFQLGKLNIPFNNIQKAKQLKLTVHVLNFKNSWDIWVYPSMPKAIENEHTVKVVSKLDATAISYLQNGGNVLLNISKGDIASKKGGDIGIGFSSIFWNTSWTKDQKPHTLGVLVNPEHPALAEFPTQYHSNWQWWDAMSHSNAIVTTGLPQLTPIVRVVDDWFKNRPLALIFEVKVGKGRLILSGIDLHTNMQERLEAQQLLYSLKRYMASNAFNPKTTIDIKEIKELLKY